MDTYGTCKPEGVSVASGSERIESRSDPSEPYRTLRRPIGARMSGDFLRKEGA